jgi:acetyltransferase-like isoleucine patch superfamily enzyme/GT2 family glycosyltransferase
MPAAPWKAIARSDIDVSVVVIGRNEGERLSRCLGSVAGAKWLGLRHEVIYVDSGSSDDSVRRAEGAGADVLVLDEPSPCAAQGRNMGWRHSRGAFVMFLDGDTELDPDFVPRALAAFDVSDRCAVWGHRREASPGQSLLTRVLDLDWIYPLGRTLYFGGDVLVRRDALASVGGFDPTLKAGEEPELCARLRARGWHIQHIDVPMTTHDLGIRTLRAYARRAYRSGIAYAEVAERMKQLGDPLWQRESRRDFRHGLLFAVAPWLFMLLALTLPAAALAMAVAALALLARTARRSAWKAPGRPLLQWQYAVHCHLQKVPALFGQVAWRRARRRAAPMALVEYRDADASGNWLKGALIGAIAPMARAWRHLVAGRWTRLWSAARLSEAVGQRLHPSNVVLGTVEVHGTARICFGRRALIYPGVYLETQGEGRIEIGDDVVLSRGVHIVAFDHVRLGAGTMVGEYASLRDANHRRSPSSIRRSGHEHAPIVVGRNVWIGRGVTLLKGVTLGDSCVVGANAVVTRPVADQAVVAGAPARPIETRRPSQRRGSDAGDLAAATFTLETRRA